MCCVVRPATAKLTPSRVLTNLPSQTRPPPTATRVWYLDIDFIVIEQEKWALRFGCEWNADVLQARPDLYDSLRRHVGCNRLLARMEDPDAGKGCQRPVLQRNGASGVVSRQLVEIPVSDAYFQGVLRREAD